MGYCYIWEFIIADDEIDVFWQTYGPEGPWIQLFKRSSGFVRTELIRDRSEPHRFVTIDYWESAAEYDRFMEDFRSEYETLDAAASGLASSERLIGHFSILG